MNGFVVFNAEEMLGRFLASSEVAKELLAGGRLVHKFQDPLAVFRELTRSEVDQLAQEASRYGGSIKGSRRYQPLPP